VGVVGVCQPLSGAGSAANFGSSGGGANDRCAETGRGRFAWREPCRLACRCRLTQRCRRRVTGCRAIAQRRGGRGTYLPGRRRSANRYPNQSWRDG